jgi:DMSO reductase family type II enzyme chaperone
MEAQQSALAGTRMAVYRFLLAALDKPTPVQHAWFAGADFRRVLELLCEQFDFVLPYGRLAATDAAEHEARYISCFEVGLPEPAVPLLASHYNQREPMPQIIHEHILFYKRFGTRPAAGNIEPADHLLTELAFLVHLDELLEEGKLERESIYRARLDFLNRQPAQWVAQAASAAQEKKLPKVYQTLLSLLAAALQQDLELTETALAALGDNQA